MEILLDSINLKEIEKLQTLNLIDGITTNPSLFSSISNRADFCSIIKEICSLVGKKYVSVQVISSEYNDMMKEAEDILSLNDNIIIKLPATKNGILACRELSNSNIKVNMTLCFSITQALLIAKAGAYYISPFIGQLEDNGENGLRLILDIVTLFKNYDFKTKILAASIRSKNHIAKVSIYGAHAITAKASVIESLAEHHLTTKKIEELQRNFPSFK